MQLNFDCAVIGAGIAGMTAAIYLKRAGVHPLLIEKSYPGGQINKTNSVENYPGFIQIDGVTLSQNIYAQVTDLGIDYEYGDVLSIENHKDYKIIKTDKDEYKVKTVIIATGRFPKELGIPSEKELIGNGISWCATCDGNLFKNQDVAVVGGGNKALEEALYLSNICKKVYLIHRREIFRAESSLIDKVKETPNIEIKIGEVKEFIKKDNKLNQIELNIGEKLNIKGLFISIGSETKLNFISTLGLDLDYNYIVVDNEMKTNIDGIYACGDVIKKNLYQLVTAASEGAIAADSVKKYLDKHK